MPKTTEITIDAYGGPEVLKARTAEVPPPGRGELLIRQSAVGVNFHDVYVRSGQYRTLTPPGVPGIEAVGVVEAIGEGVAGFQPGDRIGYVTDAYGAYAGARVLGADRAFRLPDTLSDVAAASVLLKGLTAVMLTRHVHRVGEGETVLVQAAAGGVGQLLCRMCKGLGARVIGVVGAPAKAEAARAAGADHVLIAGRDDVPVAVSDLTGGRGAAAAYDSVGRNTFQASFDSLAHTGHMVSFGQSSGPVEPVALSALAARSLTLSRPMVFHYLRDASQRAALGQALFEALDRGLLAANTAAVLPLEQAAEAHRLLESRRATGAVVLTV